MLLLGVFFFKVSARLFVLISKLWLAAFLPFFFFFFFSSSLTNLRALTLDGNFFHGRVPDLSKLTNLQVCVLSEANDTNNLCCPIPAFQPPNVQCRCVNSPSCVSSQPVVSYAQLLRNWAMSVRAASLAARQRLLQSLLRMFLDNKDNDDEDDTDVTASSVMPISTEVDEKSEKEREKEKNKKPSTRKVNAKLVDSKGRVVAFELEDGSVAQVRRTELASDGSIAGYELEDGSFIAASDATDATEKPSGLPRSTIIVISAVAGGVVLVLCIAGLFVLFHWRQRGDSSSEDDDDLTAAAAGGAPIDGGTFGMLGHDDMREAATDAELRPVKRARKQHQPRQNAHAALDVLDLPGTLATPLGAPREHGSDERLLAPKHSSGDSLPGSATRANLAGYVAPPAGSLTSWDHGSDEALKAPKHSSGDAMPGAATRADLMLYVPGAEYDDEQSGLDATPQLYISPGDAASPFGDEKEDDAPSSGERGLGEGSTSSSSGERAPSGFQLYMQSPNDDDDDAHGSAVGTPSLESASTSEAGKRGTKRRAAGNNATAAERHFSNIKLPNELKPGRKKKPAHMRKHKNPVPEFDNIVLPAEMRGRKTIVTDE